MKTLTKKCIVCGKKFAKPKRGCSNSRWEERKFCSKKCSNDGQVYWCKGLKGTGVIKPNSGSFKKGNIPWTFGGHHSEETKRKISETHKRKGIKPPCGGENSFAWKGGVSKENYLFRRTAKYKEFRKNVFERDNYTCQKCFVRGGKLQVHHLKSFAEYPELRLEVSNGQTLCISCHIQTDTYAKNLK